MTPERKKQVQKIRNQGYLAAQNRRHVQTNPYPTYSTDRDQWFLGYREFTEEEESHEDENLDYSPR